MACRTETTEIGETEYSCTQWSAEKSMLIKFKLAKAFGPALAALVSAGDNGDDGQAIANGMSSLFHDNSPEELVALMKQCIVGVARDGRKITETSFNEIFSGDSLIDVYKVFLFVVRVNFSHLMKGQQIGGLLAKVSNSL